MATIPITKPVQRRKYLEQLPRNLTTWTHETVASAISLQTQGDWSNSSLLGVQMMTDGRFAADLQKLVLGLVRITPVAKPVNEDNPQEILAAKLIQDNWHLMFPESTLIQWLRFYHLVDCGPGIIEWQYNNSMWLPVVKVFNPANTRYQHFRLSDGESPWVHMTQGGLINFTPGDGRWVLLTDWFPGVPLGLVSQLGLGWVDKQIARADRADITKQIANPKYKAITPAGEKDVQVRSAWLDDIVASDQTSIIECPQEPDGSGYDVIVIPVSRDGFEMTGEAITEANADYAVSILGSSVASELGAVGSRAAVETYRGVGRELIEAHAAVLSTVIREQVLKHFVAKNVGPTVEVPWLTWEVPVDGQSDEQAKKDVTSNEDSIDNAAKKTI